jgi:hypothetical protein
MQYFETRRSSSLASFNSFSVTKLVRSRREQLLLLPNQFLLCQAALLDLALFLLAGLSHNLADL